MTCGCLAATSEGGHFLEHQSGPEGLRKAEGEDIMILTSELEEGRSAAKDRRMKNLIGEVKTLTLMQYSITLSPPNHS